MIPPFRTPWKSLVFLLRFPFGDDFAVFRKTANMQTIRICRATAQAGIFGARIFPGATVATFIVDFARRWHLASSCIASEGDACELATLYAPFTQPCLDKAASLARRKVSAVESDDYYRVARSRARTNQLRARQRTTACSALAEIPASKTPAQRKDPHSRKAASRGPSLLRASRKSEPNFPYPCACPRSRAISRITGTRESPFL